MQPKLPLFVGFGGVSIGRFNKLTTFTTEDFLEYIGFTKAEEMAMQQHRNELDKKRHYGGKCAKKPKTCAHDAIMTAICHAPDLIEKSHKRKKRCVHYSITSDNNRM